VQAWVDAPPAHEVPLRFSDGTTVLLAAESRGAVAALGPEGARITVDRGRAVVSIAAQTGARWRFDVGPFALAAGGSRFDAAWEPASSRFELSIQDGSVRVSGPTIAGERTYVAGQHLRIAAARLEGGRMSTWLNDSVQPGDEIDVMTPMGTFTAVPRPDAARHHLAVAAGSGITPVLSIVSTLLAQEPHSRVTLLYGNRRTSSIMFLEELEDLKNAYPGRFQLVHVLSREAPDVELFHGRLDRERLTRILDALAPVESVDEWYLCGPFGLVTGAQALLRERGVASEHVHHEIFHVDDGLTPTRPRAVIDGSTPPQAVVTVTLDGRTTEVPMPSRDESVLAATLRVRPDAPYSCAGGVCGTCRARVVEGEVTMDRNYALEPEELAAGIVLACQSHPITDRVRLDYDA